MKRCSTKLIIIDCQYNEIKKVEDMIKDLKQQVTWVEKDCSQAYDEIKHLWRALEEEKGK